MIIDLYEVVTQEHIIRYESEHIPRRDETLTFLTSDNIEKAFVVLAVDYIVYDKPVDNKPSLCRLKSIRLVVRDLL